MWHYSIVILSQHSSITTKSAAASGSIECGLHGCRPRLVIKGDLCLGSGKEQEARVSQSTSGLEIQRQEQSIKSLACDVLLVAARARACTYLKYLCRRCSGDARSQS